jgi:hypothetical protein
MQGCDAMIRKSDSMPTGSGSERLPNRGKATNKQVNERVAAVAQMLVKKLHKHEIKKYLKATYGVGARQAEEYVTRARDYLIERSNRPRELWTAEALGLLEAIIRDPNSEPSSKLQANRDLCVLLGLAAPTKIAPTTPDGESPYQPLDVSKLTDAELEILHRAHQRIISGDDAGNVVDAEVVRQLPVRAAISDL